MREDESAGSAPAQKIIQYFYPYEVLECIDDGTRITLKCCQCKRQWPDVCECPNSEEEAVEEWGKQRAWIHATYPLIRAEADAWGRYTDETHPRDRSLSDFKARFERGEFD